MISLWCRWFCPCYWIRSCSVVLSELLAVECLCDRDRVPGHVCAYLCDSPFPSLRTGAQVTLEVSVSHPLQLLRRHGTTWSRNHQHRLVHEQTVTKGWLGNFRWWFQAGVGVVAINLRPFRFLFQICHDGGPVHTLAARLFGRPGRRVCWHMVKNP